jgi:ferredoxin
MAELHFESEKCMGHALCNATAPEVYELARTGNLLAPPWMPLDASLEDAAKAGAEACPARAINIVDNGATADGTENVIRLRPSFPDAKGRYAGGKNDGAASAENSHANGFSREAQAGRR